MMTEEKVTERYSVIRKIIKVDVKVTSDDEFMRCGSSERQKELNSSRKTEKGFENVHGR